MALNLRKRTVIGRELEWAEVDQNWADIETEVAQKASATHSHSISQITGLNDALSTKMNASARGIVNGVASLGADGKVPLSQLPEIATSNSGMFFPHDSLTQNDIGKLVIWKDSKCQLPVFEPEITGQGNKYILSFDKDEFESRKPAKANLEINFLEQAVGGSSSIGISFGYAYYYALFAVSTPAVDHEVAIGATITDTVDNLYDHLVDWLTDNNVPFTEDTEVSSSINYTIIRSSPTSIHIGAAVLEAPRYDNLFGGNITYDANIQVSKADNIGDDLWRCGVLSYLIPFYMRWKEEDNGNWLYFDSNSCFSIATQRSEHTFLGALDYWGAVSAGRLPVNFSEFRSGLIGTLTILGTDIFRNVTAHADNAILIELKSGIHQLGLDNLRSKTGYTFSGIVNNWYFPLNPVVSFSEEETPSIPPHCKSPVLGLVKNVVGTEVEIHTEPICQFTYSGEEIISWQDTIDIRRIFVLDPAAPGYLAPLISFDMPTMEAVLRVVSPGYVYAMDTNVSGLFYGSFSLDLFIMQIIFISSQEEE